MSATTSPLSLDQLALVKASASATLKLRKVAFDSARADWKKVTAEWNLDLEVQIATGRNRLINIPDSGAPGKAVQLPDLNRPAELFRATMLAYLAALATYNRADLAFRKAVNDAGAGEMSLAPAQTASGTGATGATGSAPNP